MSGEGSAYERGRAGNALSFTRRIVLPLMKRLIWPRALTLRLLIVCGALVALVGGWLRLGVWDRV
jgi:hypothetical protein